MRIIPGRKYTWEQIQQLRTDPTVVQREVPGHYLRYNADGTAQFVPDSQSSTRLNRVFASSLDDPFRMEDVPVIKKRTPTERVDSLMARFIADCKAAGTVPGLSDPRIAEILGQTIDTDRNGITAEEIRLLAQRFLEKAEKDKQEHDSHFVTTPSPND